jgi:hypothetical protein
MSAPPEKFETTIDRTRIKQGDPTKGKAEGGHGPLQQSERR